MVNVHIYDYMFAEISSDKIKFKFLGYVDFENNHERDIDFTFYCWVEATLGEMSLASIVYISSSFEGSFVAAWHFVVRRV